MEGATSQAAAWKFIRALQQEISKAMYGQPNAECYPFRFESSVDHRTGQIQLRAPREFRMTDLTTNLPIVFGGSTVEEAVRELQCFLGTPRAALHISFSEHCFCMGFTIRAQCGELSVEDVSAGFYTPIHPEFE